MSNNSFSAPVFTVLEESKSNMDDEDVGSGTIDSFIPSDHVNSTNYTSEHSQDNDISLDCFKTLPKVSNDVYLRLYTPLSAQYITKIMNLDSEYINFADILVIIPVLMAQLWNNITLVGNNQYKGLFDMEKILEIWTCMFGTVKNINEFEYKGNKKFHRIIYQFASEIKQTIYTYNNLYYVNDVINHYNHTFVGCLFLNIIKTLQPQLMNVAMAMIKLQKEEFDKQRLEFRQQWILKAQYLQQLELLRSQQQQQIQQIQQMQQIQQLQERKEGEEGYDNQMFSVNNKQKDDIDVECLKEGQKDENYNSFDDILLENSLLIYKQRLSDNGLCCIDDFELITSRDDLNQVIKNMDLPFLIQKKFIKLCLKYIQIDDYEGIEL